MEGNSLQNLQVYKTPSDRGVDVETWETADLYAVTLLMQ
jgi:hypothetical protein